MVGELRGELGELGLEAGPVGARALDLLRAALGVQAQAGRATDRLLQRIAVRGEPTARLGRGGLAARCGGAGVVGTVVASNAATLESSSPRSSAPSSKAASTAFRSHFTASA